MEVGEDGDYRMYPWWSLCTLYLHACQVSYRRRLRSLLLYLCYVFRSADYLPCQLILHERSGLRSVSDLLVKCLII